MTLLRVACSGAGLQDCVQHAQGRAAEHQKTVWTRLQAAEIRLRGVPIGFLALLHRRTHNRIAPAVSRFHHSSCLQV